jgi:hypothetical protein
MRLRFSHEAIAEWSEAEARLRSKECDRTADHFMELVNAALDKIERGDLDRVFQYFWKEENLRRVRVERVEYEVQARVLVA